MTAALRLRGGTTAQNMAFTGLLREVTVDTTLKTLRVHDGVTPGGFPLQSTSTAIAALVGFTPPVGMTAANVQVAIEEVNTKVNAASALYYNAVVEGGCDPTGNTDTRAAVQAAIIAAAAAGKTCYFPEGTYDIGSAAVVIGVPNVRVICESRRTIFRRSVNVNTHGFQFTGASGNVRWKSGTIRYTPSAHTASTVHVALSFEAVGAVFEDLRIEGRWYVQFNLYNCSEVTMRDCIAKGAVNRGFYTSWTTVQVEPNIVYENCVADGSETDGSYVQFSAYGFNSNGYGMGQARGVTYIGCTTRNQYGHGFGCGERISEQTLIGCRAFNVGGPGFLLQEANGYKHQRGMVVGCHAENCGYGFMVNGAYYMHLVACRALGCTYAGFLTIGCLYTIHQGCIAENNQASGFIAQAGTHAIADCIYDGCVSVGNVGWGFQNDATSANIQYVGCKAPANSLGNYSFSGSGTVTAGNS